MSKEAELTDLFYEYDLNPNGQLNKDILSWYEKWNGQRWISDDEVYLHGKLFTKNPKPTVSREALRSKLFSLCSSLFVYGMPGGMEIDEKSLSSILALLNGKKEWCEHIVWRDFDKDVGDIPSGYVFIGKGTSLKLLNEANRADDWTICPIKICGVKRPE